MGLTPAEATAAGLASGVAVLPSSPQAVRGTVQGDMLPLRNFFADTSSMVPVLDAAPFRGPIDKPLHVFAVFPGEMEEFARGQVGRFFTQKRLKPPAQVRTLPRFPSITSGGVPVGTERLKHFLALRKHRRNCLSAFAREATRRGNSF